MYSYPIFVPGHPDVGGGAPAVVGDVGVVSGREAGQVPASPRPRGPPPALVQPPLEVSAAVHGTGSAIIMIMIMIYLAGNKELRKESG